MTPTAAHSDFARGLWTLLDNNVLLRLPWRDETVYSAVRNLYYAANIRERKS